MKNKMLFSFLFLLLSGHCCHSQDYTEVYRNGILGMMNLQQQNIDTAEKYLRRALAIIPDKTIFPSYFSLCKIASKRNDTTKLKQYLAELSCIYPEKMIYEYYLEYADSSMTKEHFNHLYHPQCQITEEKKFILLHPGVVDSIIASLSDRDQSIRSAIHKPYLRKDEIDKLAEEMRYIDSSNFLVLFDCIKRYGFPRLDFPLSGSRITLIMHVDNYGNMVKLKPFLLKAIQNGNLCPSDYAYAMDRSRLASGMELIYYWFIPDSEDEKKNKVAKDKIYKINKSRKLIGLPTYPGWTGWGFL